MEAATALVLHSLLMMDEDGFGQEVKAMFEERVANFNPEKIEDSDTLYFIGILQGMDMCNQTYYWKKTG